MCSVVVLSEKPMASKQTYGFAPEETEKDMEELKKKLDTLSAVPKKKYPFPLTANQEIGWDHEVVIYRSNFITVVIYRVKNSSMLMDTTRSHVQRPNMLQTMLL